MYSVAYQYLQIHNNVLPAVMGLFLYVSGIQLTNINNANLFIDDPSIDLSIRSISMWQWTDQMESAVSSTQTIIPEIKRKSFFLINNVVLNLIYYVSLKYINKCIILMLMYSKYCFIQVQIYFVKIYISTNNKVYLHNIFF